MRDQPVSVEEEHILLDNDYVFLHDEPYAGMTVFCQRCRSGRSLIFGSAAERDLAENLYDFDRSPHSDTRSHNLRLEFDRYGLSKKGRPVEVSPPPGRTARGEAAL